MYREQVEITRRDKIKRIMIKFFRRIRYNLMGTGKTGKPAFAAGRYFKYAVGEIILVMIGILLALQVNNWNEQRKKDLKTTYYINTLTKELKKNLEVIAAKNIAIKNDLIVLEDIKQRLSNKKANMDTLIHIATNEFNLYVHSFSKLNDNTYQTLQNTGHIEYLNTWLQEELQQLSFIQNDLYDTDTSMLEDYSQTVIEYLRIFPDKTLNKTLRKKIDKEYTDAQRISAFTNLSGVKSGVYYSIQRRSIILEEKTTQLVNKLDSLSK